jgi:hypothetical protein
VITTKCQGTAVSLYLESHSFKNELEKMVKVSFGKPQYLKANVRIVP